MKHERRMKWTERTDKKMSPLDFFREQYDHDTTRGQLSRLDEALYRSLSRKGMLDEAIPEFDNEAAERLRTISTQRGKRSDLVQNYIHNYSQLASGNHDAGLHACLQNDRLADTIPQNFVSWENRGIKTTLVSQFIKHAGGLEETTREKLSKRKHGVYGENALDYYNEHFNGFTRGKLLTERRGLYNRLKKDGLLQNIPSARDRIYDGRPMDLVKTCKNIDLCNNDPLGYYKKHHSGVARGPLLIMNPSLYKRMANEGLLGFVPPGADILSIHPFDDPLCCYRNHYSGLSRGQLRRENKDLYEKLRREELLGYIPQQQNQRKHRDFGDDALVFYHTHYEGWTRGKIRTQDKSFYRRLFRDKLLQHIPLK